jgi:hypothetical protein
MTLSLARFPVESEGINLFSAVARFCLSLNTKPNTLFETQAASPLQH